jgi:hypothetical protein
MRFSRVSKGMMARRRRRARSTIHTRGGTFPTRLKILSVKLVLLSFVRLLGGLPSLN